MNDLLANAATISNMPWEDPPADCPHAIWRYSGNPVIRRDPFPTCNSVFNSAVVPFDGRFAGVFRCDNTQRIQELHAGYSEDGLDWRIDPEPIHWHNSPADMPRYDYQYDPRVLWIEDRYYVSWCNDCHGPTIGLGWTQDFQTFTQMENAFLPANRNGVLFPRRINGKYAMYSRPSDWGHTPFGDIFYSESPDLTHWGCHRWVMTSQQPWEATKIGPGPNPIETTHGWLMLHHGVLTSCNGFVYSFGAVLFDLEKPWQVVKRAKPYLLNPRAPYELVGDVPNVVFPCSTLVDADTGRIAIYYGAADTVTGLAFTTIDRLLDFVDRNG